MRKTWLKTISGVALAILLALTLSQVRVSGQDAREQQSQDAKETGPQESSEHSTRARKLEGTWRVQVTPRNCQTGDLIATFASLLSYTRGGVLLETTSTVSPALRSPGHGVWRHIGGRRYASSFIAFLFNPAGSFVGTSKPTSDIRLSRNGDELNITSTVEVRDANANLIQTGCVTATGTRFE